MSYATIVRGRFGGDRFTRVLNAAVRDKRLSYKARGLLIFIASHREGWGIGIEQLIANSPGGAGAIRSGLKELEAVGYLRRYRVRDELGCLGGAYWVVTDDPESLPERVAELARSLEGKDLVRLQSSSSEPKCDFPGLDNLPEENRTPKKTNHKKTNTQEQGEEEGARARASELPATDADGDQWGVPEAERPAPDRGGLLERTVIPQIAEETGLGLEPWQHRRLVLEHLPAAFRAVKELADDRVGPTELLEWLRSDHDTTMSLYAVLSTRCRPGHLGEALPVWVARNRTPGGLPGPSVPKVPRPRREPAPMADGDPFTRAGAPPTCTVHLGITLTADATGLRTRCHRCEDLPGPEPFATLDEPAGALMGVLDEGLPDTAPAPPEHCGDRSCHEQRRHVIRFNPQTEVHEDLGPCPRCHPDRVREGVR
ncbi:hypothetical protein [Nocardiopsis listeri]|uniref:hypothetical protein n=1 Tax=Nocardiopsis listeri TaxID=53440 RepID=UPI00083779D4|nr:hypothetical protein [Nocardiopsis listeri]